nr:secreted acidic protein 1A-like [Procambarus clarkii]
MAEEIARFFTSLKQWFFSNIFAMFSHLCILTRFISSVYEVKAKVDFDADQPLIQVHPHDVIHILDDCEDDDANDYEDRGNCENSKMDEDADDEQDYDDNDSDDYEDAMSDDCENLDDCENSDICENGDVYENREDSNDDEDDDYNVIYYNDISRDEGYETDSNDSDDDIPALRQLGRRGFQRG